MTILSKFNECDLVRCFVSLLIALCIVSNSFAQTPANPIQDDKAKRAEALFIEGVQLASQDTAVPLRAGLEKIQQALQIFIELNDKKNQAFCLNWIGIVQTQLGNKQEALRVWIRVLELSEHVTDTHQRTVLIATLRLNMGGAYHDIGEMSKALDAYAEARKLQEELGEKTAVAQILSSVALIYSELGNPQKALSLLEEASPLIDPEKDPNNAALILNNTGVVYLESINVNPVLIPVQAPKAVESLQKASPLLIRACKAGDCNRPLMAYVVNNLGKALEYAGDPTEALNLFLETIELADLTGNLALKAKCIVNVGSAYASLGKFEQALDYWNQSLPLLEITSDRRTKAIALASSMFVWRRLRNPRFAIFYGKQAVSEYQKLRGTLTTFERTDKKNFLESIEGYYRALTDLLIAEGRIAEAEEILAMLKDEEVFDFVRRDDKVAGDLKRTVSLTETERAAFLRYEQLASNITKIGREFEELDQQRKAFEEENFPKQPRYDELKGQLADATAVFQKYLDALKTSFGQKDERVVQIDSSVKNILHRMKANRTAVVSTIVGKNRLNIIVTTANIQRAHTVDITSKDLNAKVAEFRLALTDPKTDPRPSGQVLYDILMKPIESDLDGIRADTILWSLDGTLRYIPTAAIWDKQKGYLADRFSNVLLTLASRETLGMNVEGKEDWRAVGVGVSKESEGFSALTAVPDELDCIVTDPQTPALSAVPVCKSGVVAGRKLLDDKFTLSAFENALGRYQIVHIASHFKLQPGSDRDSFLLLGGGERKRFTVEDLRTISLTDVELIVLSACNTATPGGEKANGIEIEGFGAVAQKQGAKAVIATLWPVADESTRDVMVEFYRLYGKGSMNKAAAIQKAQKAMISGKIKPSGKSGGCRADTLASGKPTDTFKCDATAPYSHPYFWSPFVLIGNWQ
jgi:CHAT domain-containing protein